MTVRRQIEAESRILAVLVVISTALLVAGLWVISRYRY